MRYVRFLWARGALALVIVLAFCGSSGAQNLGSLHGRIVDPSGAAVVRPTVQVVAQATGVERKAGTDSTGNYSLVDLNPGVYKLTVSQVGFATIVRDNIRVLVASTTAVDLKLQLGSVSQEMVVQGATAPLVNTDDATTGNPFSEQQVENLPFLARNVVNLLSLQPGVVYSGNSDSDLSALGSTAKLDNREGVVNGVRGNQSNITVDGVDSNNWFNQGAFSSALPLTLDSVQEVRVTTGNANATDGTSSGGQVALVTKSGSNAFHGNARWYYRTSGFTANSYFNKLQGISRPKLLRNIGGGSLGGPAIKNRLFFFFDTEERRDASAVTQGPRSIPSDALKDGVLIYGCATPANCPGGTVQGLTTSHVVPAGAYGLSPAQFKMVDPAGLGVNQAMIKYMSLFPSGGGAGFVPSTGVDGGLSFTGYRFNAPSNLNSNIYIGRIDYNLTADGRHSIFWRGNLTGASDTLVAAQFPGQPPAQNLLNNSRGMAVQYQGQLTPMLINTARWGFTRAGVALSGISGPSFGARDFDSVLNFGRRPNGTIIPVHEFEDTVSWAHGKHTFTFGGLLRLLQVQRTDASSAYPTFSINQGTCPGLCADAYNNVTSVLNAPQPVSAQYFTEPFMLLTGSITTVSATLLSDPHAQTFMAPGTVNHRTTAEHGFEFFTQDSWHFRSNITVTAGLRYEYDTPPWEIHGFQVAPTIDLHNWFAQRIANMNAGIASNTSPLLSWDLAGRANGKPSWYNPDRNNFAPRFAVAWSPNFQEGVLKKLLGHDGQSSLRAGFGIFYDRVGEPIALDSDNYGSPGVSTRVANGTDPFDLATSPRFSGTCSVTTGCTGLPDVSQFVPVPTSAKLPFTPSPTFSNYGFFVDPHLRTPYTMDLSVSYQREIGRNTSVEVAYVGTLGRKLSAKADYGQYLNIKDPKSGQTLWDAERALETVVGPNYKAPAVDPKNLAALATIQNIPFFQNMLPNMPAALAMYKSNPAYANLTPTQAYYAFQLQTFAGGPSWACGVAVMDRFPSRAVPIPSPWNNTVDPKGQGYVVLDQQFTSLGGWTNWGTSDYHSLQVSVHHNVGNVIFTGSYVFSKSIDNGSSPENGDVGGDYGSLVGLIQNPFDPGLNRAVSDFDVRHNFNGNFLLTLPFGRGERYGSAVGKGLNALIGGWQIAGLARWRSGFPLTVGNGFNYPTSWQRSALGTLTNPVSTHVTKNGPGGLPNIFSDPASVLANDFAFTLPGFGGTRNAIRGPGYFSADAGLYKTFRLPWSEKQRLQYRVTAFNVFNNVNFSPGAAWAPGNISGWNGLTLDPTSPKTFGQITQTAGPRGGAREMEMALRFEF